MWGRYDLCIIDAGGMLVDASLMHQNESIQIMMRQNESIHTVLFDRRTVPIRYGVVRYRTVQYRTV
jgi:hypothetical protein